MIAGVLTILIVHGTTMHRFKQTDVWKKETGSAIGRAVYSVCVRIDLLAYLTAADGWQFNQSTGHCKMCADNYFLSCGNGGIGAWLIWRQV